MVAARDKKVEAKNTFYQNIGNKDFWNPLENKHIEAVDAGFEAMGSDLNSLQKIVTDTRIMPTSAGKALRGAFISNDPVKVANAATVAANLLARNQNVFTSVDGSKELEDNAVAFRHDTEHWGLSPEEAAKRIIRNQSPEYKAKVKALLKTEDVDAIIRKQGADGTLLNDMRAGFDPSFLGLAPNPALESTPGARNVAMSDFGELLKEKYLESAGGDMGLAKKQALTQFKKVWGVSAVNGKETIMRFAPERAPAYAGIENVADHIAEQAISAVKEWNGTDIKRKDLFHFMPVNETAAQYDKGLPPRYILTYTDKNGNPQTIPNTFYADPALMRNEQTAKRAAESAKINTVAGIDADMADLNRANSMQMLR